MSDKPLTAKDIKRGCCYEAKTPLRTREGFVNDRQVRYVGTREPIVVQYDGPAVADGRHYPTVSLENFLAWAGRDVTDLMPAGKWRPWPGRNKT